MLEDCVIFSNYLDYLDNVSLVLYLILLAKLIVRRTTEQLTAIIMSFNYLFYQIYYFL